MKTLIIHTDGGARGNPGPAAVGILIQAETGEVLHGFGRKIGNTTNNIAEYRAVIEALSSIKDAEHHVGSSSGISTPLSQALEGGSLRLKFFLDSELVVKQLNGIYRVKEAHLRELLLEVRSLEQTLGAQVSYTHVRREQNREADRYVNQALDSPSSV